MPGWKIQRRLQRPGENPCVARELLREPAPGPYGAAPGRKPRADVDNGETAQDGHPLFPLPGRTPWELEVVTRHHDRFAKVDGEWYFTDKAIEIRGGFSSLSPTCANTVSID